MRKLKETCIDGDFEGWDGDKVYKLDDGSKWELVSYTYSYTYAYRPKAILWQDNGRFLLQVQGVSDMQEVREVW